MAVLIFTDNPTVTETQLVLGELKSRGVKTRFKAPWDISVPDIPEFDAELVYAKRVRKASLDKYTATTPPHVQAARKLGGRAGPVVRYVITGSGPEPVEFDASLPGAIDYGHYVEKVMRPVGEAILAPLGLDFDAATGQPHQMSLL